MILLSPPPNVRITEVHYILGLYGTGDGIKSSRMLGKHSAN